ncbi:MAG: lysophospholipid acyltransferase family protein [Chthoniobacterales bacterium]
MQPNESSPAGRSLWKSIRHRGEWLVVRSVAWLVPRLPRPWCHFGADVAGTLAAFVHVSGRRVAMSNLEVAFGDKLTTGQRAELVRQSYRYFCRGMADLYWSSRLTRDNLHEFIDLGDLENLRAAGSERGYIFACLHYGSYEWIAIVLGLCGIECTAVAQSFKNPLLTDIFARLREASGQKLIPRQGALLRAFKALVRQRSAFMAVDLTVSAKLPSVPIVCFGLQKCVTLAPAWLHQRTGAPVIPIYCEPLPGGRNRLVVCPALDVPPGASQQEIAQALWDCCEPVIRRNPAPWLWMYKHWRYRPPHAARSYPDYANESPHFRKLLARMEKEEAAAVGEGSPAPGAAG